MTSNFSAFILDISPWEVSGVAIKANNECRFGNTVTYGIASVSGRVETKISVDN